jgi:hypothetical protein
MQIIDIYLHPCLLNTVVTYPKIVDLFALVVLECPETNPKPESNM